MTSLNPVQHYQNEIFEYTDFSINVPEVNRIFKRNSRLSRWSARDSSSREARNVHVRKDERIEKSLISETEGRRVDELKGRWRSTSFARDS